MVFFFSRGFAQQCTTIKMVLDTTANSLRIKQTLFYKNTSKATLNNIVLIDWNNSYNSKTSPLAERFSEEYDSKFHFAKSEDRGYTTIQSVVDENNNKLKFKYDSKHPDNLNLSLKKPLHPNNETALVFDYTVKLPNIKFTGYGVDKNSNYNLRYWYFTPAIYDNGWIYHSNLNLDDLYTTPMDIDLKISYPKHFNVISELDEVTPKADNTIHLRGLNRVDSRLILTKENDFKSIKTDVFTISSNLNDKDINAIDKVLATDRIIQFLTKELGPYKNKKLLVTKTDYSKDKLYGINQLPKILRPFPEEFQYEVKLLKSTLKLFINNSLFFDNRHDYWLSDGMQIYYLMKYVDFYYPESKLLGELAKIWGIRSFNAAKKDFNYQYYLYYMQIVRINRDQPLNLPKDQLLKFNSNISSKYKSAIGFDYLKDYCDTTNFDNIFKKFFVEYQGKQTSSNDFSKILKGKCPKNIDWYFDNYINSNKRIDYKLKSAKVVDDSIKFIIKNKYKSNFPISLYEVKKDSVLAKYWYNDINTLNKKSISYNGGDQLVINYEQIIPEFNLRNNHKSLNSNKLLNKPFQVRIFKDLEDPNYNQVFIMPILEYKNIYDGITLGGKLYNKSVLRKTFNYNLTPKYSVNSKTLTGSFNAYVMKYYEDSDLFKLFYGIYGNYSSFGRDAFVRKFTPSISLYFRDSKDYRSNLRSQVQMRLTSINKTIGPDSDVIDTAPNYDVVNLRYLRSNAGLIKHSRWYNDLQFSKNFGKVTFNYEYRKLSENNRQFNLRCFAGVFLYNNTQQNDDYFSFALDRPTDYLFDYGYLGRSEASGLFSQQIIVAEGGFKSFLEPRYANQWMTTANAITTIWRYIEAYGDVGLVKNNSQSPEFVYDSGIRLNLVEDYFEIYFPVYSKLGWEITQNNYAEKIRFTFTVDPQILIGLFKRKWL